MLFNSRQEEVGTPAPLHSWDDNPVSKFRGPWAMTSVAVLVVAMLVSGVYLWFFQNKKPKIFSDKQPITLQLRAEASDASGTLPTSKFILSASKKLNSNDIKGLVRFKPEINYAVKERKVTQSFFRAALAGDGDLNNAYELTPETPLEEGKVYAVEAKDSKDVDIDHDYGWAFQTKAAFQVVAAVPDDKATDVSVATGIELTFNRDNITEPEKYFSIEPKVEGKFKMRGETLVFIPKQRLAEAQVYKVTVKKDLPLSGSNDRLSQDYTLSFETEKKNKENNLYLSFNPNFISLRPQNSNHLPLWVSYDKADDLKNAVVRVYKFEDENKFLTGWFSFDQSWNSWVRYNRHADKLPDGAKLLFESAGIKTLKENYGLLLPQTLSAGKYLVQIVAGKELSSAWLQVSDASYYLSVLDKNSLLWVYDGSSHNWGAGTKLSSVDELGGAQELGQVDGKGVLRFETPKNEIGKRKILKITLANNQANNIFVTANSGGRIYDFVGNFDNNYDYLSYLKVDRPVYKPNDPVKFWGIAKGRDNDLRGKKLKITVSGWGYNGSQVFYETESVVSAFDTFGGDLKLEGLDPGYYQLEAKFENKSVANASLEVANFVKPLYQLVVESDRTAIFSGDKINFSVRGEFFDGTPLSNGSLKYNYTISGNQNSGVIKLDKNGRGVITAETKKSSPNDSWDNNSSYSDYLNFQVNPERGEEGDIYGSSNVEVFNQDVYLQADNVGKQQVVKLNKIDLSGINKNNDNGLEFVGQPIASAKIDAQLKESCWKKIADPDVYSDIEKRNEKKWHYENISRVVENFSGTTDAHGEWRFDNKYPSSNDCYYTYEFRSKDSRGLYAFAFGYVSKMDAWSPGGSGNDMWIGLKADKENYSVNDEIKLHWELRDGTPLLKDSLLYRRQRAFDDYQVIDKTDYSEKFSEAMVPGVAYRVVALGPNGFVESNDIIADYQKEDRRLKIDINTDKSFYRPGEKINLNIDVKDKNDKGIAARLNVASVDESLYHVVGDNSAEVLGSLYQAVINYPRVDMSIFDYDKMNMAEGGGCFLGNTLITMADGHLRPIKNILVGDEILTLNENKQQVKAIVNGISSHKVEKYLVINGELEVTPEHRLRINDTWLEAGHAKIGDNLVNANGQIIKIRSIESIVAHDVPVYNIVVNKEHTYLADNFWVHNEEKGGGVRKQFSDVPLFEELSADKNGQAKTSFFAPDNLTSWRVKVIGYDPERLLAGQSEKLVPVKLPFFVDASVGTTFLTADKPVVRLRAFGEKHEAGADTEFSLKIEGLNYDKKITAKAESYFPLENLRPGEYEMLVQARQGNEQDSYIKKIKIVDNYFLTPQVETKDVVEGAANLPSSQNGLTRVVFSDASLGRYVPSLISELYYDGLRSDGRAAAILSSNILHNNFNLDYGSDDNLSSYIKEDGGLSLLPYSSSDLELSAKMALLAPDLVSSGRLGNYFENVLRDDKTDIHRSAKALCGLASLGRPVLTKLDRLSQAQGLTLEDKIYINLGLAKLGDLEKARDFYNAENSKLNNPGEGADKNIYLAAQLVVIINNQDVDKMWTYLNESKSQDQLLNLERVAFMQTIISRGGSQEAKLSYDMGDEKQTVDVSNGSSTEMLFTTSQIAKLRFSDIKGQIKVTTYFEKSADSQQQKSTGQVSLSRKYFLQDKEADKFTDGDLVKVELTVKNLKGTNHFSVIDYLPSNMRSATGLYDSENILPKSADSCNGFWAPMKNDENKMYFSYYSGNCSEAKFYYWARVVSRGSYQAEPAMIFDPAHPEKINFSGRQSIVSE